MRYLLPYRRGGAVNTHEEDHPHLITNQIMTVFLEQSLALPGFANYPQHFRMKEKGSPQKSDHFG